MNSSSFTRLVLICLSLITLGGCASKPKVFSDFDPAHDFTKNETFTWVHTPPMLQAGDYPVSALAETRLTAAIKGEFLTKGYRFVEDEAEADFSVVYTMGARDKIEIVRYANEYYHRRYHRGVWGAYYFPYFFHFPFDHERLYREELKTYTDGNIAVDIFDTKTKLPIWHTKASKRLSNKDLNAEMKNAEEVAIDLLQHFPLIGCEVEISDQCRPFE